MCSEWVEGSLLEVSSELSLESDLEVSLEVWLSVNDLLEISLDICWPHALIVVEISEVTAAGDGEVSKSDGVSSSNKFLTVSSKSGLEKIASGLVGIEPCLLLLVGVKTSGKTWGLSLVVALLVEVKDRVNGPDGVDTWS